MKYNNKCHLCDFKLRPIKKDWNTRKYHKKCFKIIKSIEYNEIIKNKNIHRCKLCLVNIPIEYKEVYPVTCANCNMTRCDEVDKIFKKIEEKKNKRILLKRSKSKCSICYKKIIKNRNLCHQACDKCIINMFKNKIFNCPICRNDKYLFLYYGIISLSTYNYNTKYNIKDYDYNIDNKCNDFLIKKFGKMDYNLLNEINNNIT